MTAVRILAISEEHIAGFHAVLDEVARDSRYMLVDGKYEDGYLMALVY